MRKILFLVAFFLGVNGAGADCIPIGGEWSTFEGSLGCYNSYPSTQTCYTGDVNLASSNNPWYQNANCGGTTRVCVQTSAEFLRCSFASGGNQICNYSGFRCGSQCEADSLQCVNEGGAWTENPNAVCGKSCTTNGCTAADTANLERLVHRCDSLGGTNDYELVNNGSEGCGLSGFCNLCNGNAYKKLLKDQQKNCCEQGHAPDTTKVKCTVESITSTDKKFIVDGQNACLSGDPQIIITPNGESYREGCDDAPPSGGSSDSHGSSDSQESSSSGGGSSSGNTDENALAGQLEDIKDSLHKIIRYDSTTASNSIDLANYLYDIKVCLEAGTCGAGAPTDYTGEIQAVRDTLHNSNTLLKQIADKDLSVSVNGGLTAEKQAELIANISNVADSMAKYGIANGARLDSIIEGLKHLGADSVAHGLDSVRNEYIREGIDSLYSLRTGLDSTFADWSDTSGAAAAGDTTGKGGELDALGDSLGVALWGYPCDTTGGKSCNTAYIGANGIANARNGWKGAADALGDSLNGGAVKDSINSWTNKIVNNGVLSGNGAATCPAVFNRTWQVPLGTGITYTFGPFGKIVCYDFFGGITFWALARIVLRAMVAITCMWWLYHAVTGTTARGDDDED